MLVLVAEVVLAVLAGRVPLPLEQLRDRRVLGRHADVRAGHPHLGQAGAVDALAGDEGRPAGGAALLTVGVREAHPLVGDAVDVGRAIAHQAVAVAAQVRDADVITPEHHDVRLAIRHQRSLLLIRGASLAEPWRTRRAVGDDCIRPAYPARTAVRSRGRSERATAPVLPGDRRVRDPAEEEDRAGRHVAEREQERPVDPERHRLGRHAPWPASRPPSPRRPRCPSRRRRCSPGGSPSEIAELLRGRDAGEVGAVGRTPCGMPSAGEDVGQLGLRLDRRTSGA